MITANIHEGFSEYIDFSEFAKNAPKGTSNPQAVLFERERALPGLLSAVLERPRD